MLLQSTNAIRIRTRHFFIEPIREEFINETYLGWLNDPSRNSFLEVRKSWQGFESVCTYVNNLRSFPGCDLLTILTIRDRTHVGNISLTPSLDASTRIYGIMIGDVTHPLSLYAGAEASLGVIDYLFESVETQRLLEGVLPGNTRAIKLLEGIGFTRVGNETSGYTYELRRSDWFALHRQRLLRVFRPSHDSN